MYSLKKFPAIIKNWVGFQYKFSKEINEKKFNYHLGENGTQLKEFYSTKTITFQWFIFGGLVFENSKTVYYKT